MSEPFDPKLPLIIVDALVRGPRGDVKCRLAVDTGASGTQISHHTLRLAGYNVTTLFDPVRMNTVGGRVTAGRLRIERLTCLGHTASDLRVVCHTVHATSHIDGLLGLDFLAGRVLTIDFVRHTIALRLPRPWWAFWR